MRALGCVLAIAALSAPARADVLKVFGEANLGGMGGKGVAGDLQDEAFYANAPSFMYGVDVAARFLILEGHIRHHQFRGGGELATWTQFSVGIGMDVDLGDEKQKREHEGAFVEIGALIGGGLGTGRQVDPPLSNDEITDKAAVGEGHFGFGKHLNKVFDVGAAITGSYGYFIKTEGGDMAANDTSTHYRSAQVEVMGFFRINIKLL